MSTPLPDEAPYGAEVVEQEGAKLRAPLRAALEALRARNVRFYVGRGRVPLAAPQENFRSYHTRIGNGRELWLVLFAPRLDAACRVQSPAAVEVTLAGRNRRDCRRFVDGEAAAQRLIEIVAEHETR